MQKGEKMIVEYMIAKECENTETYYFCHKCEKCGRKFESGIMIDDGGTTFDEKDS